MIQKLTHKTTLLFMPNIVSVLASRTSTRHTNYLKEGTSVEIWVKDASNSFWTLAPLFSHHKKVLKVKQAWLL